MSERSLAGVFVALFTPLLRDDPKCLRNEIDYEKARLLIDDLIEAEVTGLVPVGSTGQSATLSHRQHLEFIRFVIEHVDGRVSVIAGAGSNCTRESVDMIQAIREIADVPVLCATGYYNGPPSQGIKAHFLSLVEETDAPIVLYNVPPRTSSYISPEMVIELAQHPRIVGLKQAVDFCGDDVYREDTARIIRETKDLDFVVLSGEDDGVATLMEMGGHGVISATANIPEAAQHFVEIVASHEMGDAERARQAQKECSKFVEAVFCRKSPIPLGTLLNSPLYLPLVSVRDTDGGALEEARLLALVKESCASLHKYHAKLG